MTRTEIETIARRELGADARLDGVDDRQVIRSVLARVVPTLDTVGASDAYLDAALRAAVDRHDATAPSAPAGAEAARARMILDAENAWRSDAAVVTRHDAERDATHRAARERLCAVAATRRGGGPATDAEKAREQARRDAEDAWKTPLACSAYAVPNDEE
ncbi:hypothetical protein [Anaeromyxobacter soli]|uniref:hypothetical protein n=1 Tax=Anaeromyxobacter soli TaxID=2922725 RepID=UPI001FAECA14|nr:hypothetical protein [Anaeromyxobacter sp. SG29]